MRDIKFRAWEKSLKQIIQVDNIDFEMKLINTESAWRMFDEIELMQYTGLKDKNDKEIYEGDIVYACWYSYEEPLDDITGEVVYSEGKCAFEIWGEEIKKMQELNNQGAYAFEIEVIGNIYD
jgi:uncharacterized phage protein (TIGR01671 family)